MDPLTRSYPELTPYQFASNTPIWAIDLDGLEALVATSFKSREGLEKSENLTITYEDKVESSANQVSIIHKWSDDLSIKTAVSSGISQKSVKEIKDKMGSMSNWEKVKMGFKHPSIAWYRGELGKMYEITSGARLTKGSLTWSTALELQSRVDDPNGHPMYPSTEFGLSNTFLHFFGQSLSTSLFGESASQIAADIHERLDDGQVSISVDNLVDMVNNAWGREFGNQLADKYDISSSTTWTNELTSNYLNDVMDYMSNSLGVKFKEGKRFSKDDKFVGKFTNHLNKILGTNKKE